MWNGRERYVGLMEKVAQKRGIFVDNWTMDEIGFCGDRVFAYVAAMRVAIGVRVDIFLIAGEEEIGTCDDVGMADDGGAKNFD